MSLIKSFSVGHGDMFYIKHDSSNFTIIDCYLGDEVREIIVDEIIEESKYKAITRFISTHPDNDHIKGLKYLDDRIDILNFYCVKNEVTKEDETSDFIRYKELRNSDKAFYIYKGCSRKWMNRGDRDDKNDHGSSGINILWPDTQNEDYKKALEDVKSGGSPNNISPIIKYSLNNGATVLWMGDLEKEFLEKIEENVDWVEVDILFAPHHGRKSGKIPSSILDKLNLKIIVIGEAPSENINYYAGYNTITQNMAGDIVFDCEGSKIHIYVSNIDYKVDYLIDECKTNLHGNYIGTLLLD